MVSDPEAHDVEEMANAEQVDRQSPKKRTKRCKNQKRVNFRKGPQSVQQQPLP